jgi:hypothetical protein
MSVTRDNHYVPQWYQEGFREPGSSTLAYLDLSPRKINLPNGQQKEERSRFNWTPTKCFRQRDLYSTFFGAAVNDEIERRLFGEIDTNGAHAVRVFAGTDEGEWIRRFEDFFIYIDAQKLRTPKGLDWLKAQYPRLDQNELLFEMQGVRTLHCTIWSSGVREIVSAEDSAVKFITTDHPVTIYNYALPPGAPMCMDPSDPGIALKASQTIFPLGRDHCLILTNLEYARDPNANPVEKRTFARNFQQTMVLATAMIRERKLTAEEVARINFVLKKRARRFVAAGREEWLYPERTVQADWRDLRDTLRPPDDELYHFGGEMYASYTDGRVHYQDEYGRTEKPREILVKDIDEKSLGSGSNCGCGSGKQYRVCCKGLAVDLRRSWDTRSIRERNLFLENAIAQELKLDERNWLEVRQQLTDDQIRRLYTLFAHLWPLETDLLQLLPKPDGRPRAVYTGSIHPATIPEFAMGAPLYFGELLIEHPFVHGRSMRPEYSPIDNPRAYRQEFLKSVLTFLMLMPLVRDGLVELVPDPVTFSTHLREQMMSMAKARLEGVKMDRRDDPRIAELMKEDAFRNMMALPPRALRAELRASEAGLDEQTFLKTVQRMKEADPLAILQEDTFEGGKEGGLLTMAKLAPNFEMSMYLAQATGAVIVTDSVHRWREIRAAMRWRPPRQALTLRPLSRAIEAASFAFPNQPEDLLNLSSQPSGNSYPAIMRDAFRYASDVDRKGAKPNFEAGLAARFASAHAAFQARLSREGIAGAPARIDCAFPLGGIQDNTINRLLLMSSSERHTPSVPMAFYVHRPDSAQPKGNTQLPGLS